MPDLSVRSLVVGPFSENVYILKDPACGEGIIIDPGDEPGRILDACRSFQVDVTAIVLTHGHLDHTGAVQPIKEALNVPLLLHEEEVHLYQSLPNQGRMFGLILSEPPPPDRLIKEGENVAVGAISLSVLHTPGHTPGHITLCTRGHAFVGDCLFRGSIGRTDLPGGDYATLMESLAEKIMALPEETIVHSGHGPETSIGEESRSNPFLSDGI